MAVARAVAVAPASGAVRAASTAAGEAAGVVRVRAAGVAVRMARVTAGSPVVAGGVTAAGAEPPRRDPRDPRGGRRDDGYGERGQYGPVPGGREPRGDRY